MPTFGAEARFRREYAKLTQGEREQFRVARIKFVTGLRAGRVSSSLRIKRVQGTTDVYEMTWAPDGRATFRYGDAVRLGDPHIVWRRVGGHDIFDEP